MANSYENSVVKALLSLDSIDNKIKGISTSIAAINTEAINKLKLIGKDVSGTTDFNNKLKEQEALIKKLSEQLSKLTSEEKKYGISIEQLNSSLAKQRAAEESASASREKANQKTSQLIVNQRALAKAADLEATANSNVVSSYMRLNAQREIAKIKLQKLTLAENSSRAEIKKAQREFDVLSQKTAKADQATGKFAKGGLLNLVGGFKNLLGAFGIVGGVQLFANLARNAFDVAKKLDSLNFALKAVTKSSVETLDAQRFLSDIANRFGANILTLTERYVKFLAATKQTNLSLEQTNSIFSVFTKAAGVLGLRADELNRIFLALEQMVSKNKVTTEELRRQLGESLPGAFNLMANALGISTAQLDKMLRSGKILAEDALPKLAQEVDRVFGTFEGDQIETLTANTERLNNAFTRLVDNSSGAITSAVGGSQGVLTKLLNGFADIAENIQVEQDGFISFGDDLILLLDDLARITPFANEKLTKLKNNIVKTAKDAKAAAEDLQSFNNKIELLLAAGKGGRDVKIPLSLEFSIGGGAKKNKINEQIAKEIEEENKRAASRRIEILREINLRIEKKGVRIMNEEDFRKDFLEELERIINNEPLVIKKSFDFLLESPKRNKNFLDNEIKRINDLIAESADKIEIGKLKKAREALQREIDDLLGVKAKGSGSSKSDEPGIGSRKFLENIISNLQKQQSETATTGKAWGQFASKIEEAKKALEEFDRIANATKNIENVGKKLKFKPVEIKPIEGETLGIISDEDIKAAERYRREIQALKEQLDELFQTISSNALDNLGFGSLKKFFDGTIKDLFTTIDKLEAIGEISGGEAGFKKFAVVFEAVGEVAKETFDFIDSAQEQQFQNQLRRLDIEKENSLRFAGSSATAKQKIEEDFDRKSRELQNKRAEQEKKKAIFNATVNTAVGITSALAKANIPLAVAIGILGAVEIAFIASQKIPKFEKGTRNAPEGIALVDEKRAEVHTDRRGRVKSFGKDKPNYRKLDSGDKIYPSFSDWADNTMKNSYNFAGDLASSKSENNYITKEQLDSVISKHFSKIQVLEQNIDEKGITMFISGQNARTELRNKRASLRGFKR